MVVTESASTKRPTCSSCSKPACLCLCSRLRTPILHNPVAVTVLQHSLEKNHPLNSTRIAKIGLKNVDVVTVSDVNFQAQFSVRLVDSSCGNDGVEYDESRHLFDEMPSKGKNDEFLETAILGVGECGVDDTDLEGRVVEGNEFNGDARRGLCQNVTNLSGADSSMNFTVVKYGTMSAFSKFQEMSFDQLLASSAAVDEIRKGFVVKKLQVKQLEGIDECEESEEFEIQVPAGSVLLFPSERSVDAEALSFEVKNLIVLDGTWAKAKRMYNENPWLRLLPHLRLDLGKLSLYNEVRQQPRAGYLSTIESIVYAMKAVGEDADGLDGLLDVFESMVGDQRRYKNERLSKVAEE
ncbi:hypothetical protein C2S52_005951 [Perilla frutescens var. hirtella]|nr:hypothetical protein C2S51_009807 [Perilla frutescens var. frutescens]KAH6786399.1 hypothetical protein C2S52_005951 [Perilla frutescens var. hirtella]